MRKMTFCTQKINLGQLWFWCKKMFIFALNSFLHIWNRHLILNKLSEKKNIRIFQNVDQKLRFLKSVKNCVAKKAQKSHAFWHLQKTGHTSQNWIFCISTWLEIFCIFSWSINFSNFFSCFSMSKDFIQGVYISEGQKWGQNSLPHFQRGRKTIDLRRLFPKWPERGEFFL